jgi:DNA-directed RNA polymerase subunit L
MENYDYTIGKVIEYLLNELYFNNEQILSYIGFIKKHPHDSFSIIRIIFKDSDNSNVENIKILLSSCAEKAVEIFSNLNNNFI